MPYVEDIFVSMSKIRKQIFNLSELKGEYEKIRAHNKEALEFEEMCEILFHFSVIGNQPSQHTARIFKYEHRGARLNTTEQGIIHLGLLRSLQIT